MPDRKQQMIEGAEKTSGITVLHAKEIPMTLNDAIFEYFAELLMEQTFHPVLDISDTTKGHLQNLLLHAKQTGDTRAATEAIQNTQDWKEYRANLVEHYKMLAADNDLLIAVADGKPVGIGGCQKIGQKDGREVYEIAHLVILPERRGQGISTALTDAIITRAREHDPESLLLSHTKNTRLIGNLQKRGATEITPEEHVSIHNFEDENTRQEILERRTIKAQEGMKAFIL